MQSVFALAHCWQELPNGGELRAGRSGVLRAQGGGMRKVGNACGELTPARPLGTETAA